MLLIMLMVGDRRGINAKVIEQRAGNARIFRSDQIHAFKRFNGARGHIGKVANRRGNNVKAGHNTSS